MMTANLKKLVAGAALASVLIGGVAATPAQAQPTWRYMYGSDAYDRNPDNPRGVPQLGICQTDYQVRRAFMAQGFDRVWLGAPASSKRLQVRVADKSGTYLINYNRCTAEIIDQKRIR